MNHPAYQQAAGIQIVLTRVAVAANEVLHQPAFALAVLRLRSGPIQAEAGAMVFHVWKH